MDNLVVTLTNLYGLRAFHVSLKVGDISNAIILGLSVSSSMIYHMLEHSKHHMTGMPQFQKYEKIALNADRFFAGLAFCTLVYKSRKFIFNRPLHKLAYKPHKIISSFNPKLKHYSIGTIACLILSECQHLINLNIYPVRYVKGFYMLTHCFWHVGAFHIAYILQCNTK